MNHEIVWMWQFQKPYSGYVKGEIYRWIVGCSRENLLSETVESHPIWLRDDFKLVVKPAEVRLVPVKAWKIRGK